MNCALRFKQKEHYDAYLSEFSMRLRKRFFMGLNMNLLIVIGVIIQFLTTPQSNSIGLHIWFGARTILSFMWIMSIYWMLRRLNKYSKYSRFIDLALDVLALITGINCLIAFQTIPYEVFGSTGINIFGFSLGIMFVCGISVVGSWRIRSLGVLLQIGFYIAVLYLESPPGAHTDAIQLIQTLIMYLVVIYLEERYVRFDFLEKRKIYDDSKAIKKILDDITEGILIVSPERMILYANKPVELMFSFAEMRLDPLFAQIKVVSTLINIEKSAAERPAIEVSSDQCTEKTTLLSDVFEDIAFRLLNRTQGKTQEKTIAVEGITQNPLATNGQRNYNIKFTPSLYNEKQVIVVNISDTTDRDNLISLRDNNNYKTRLLASVSHELRTPLNGSINFTEQALADPHVPTSVKEKCILPALRSNRLLMYLINDILDFSQIQANKLRLVYESKDICKTAEECIELMEIQAHKKNLQLELECTLPAERRLFTTDHNRFKQIVLNLLSNAVKFTFEGGIKLQINEIEVSDEDPEKSEMIQVVCADTGIGISEENQMKLFQAFEKIELGEKTAINSTGVGLGLVISNNLARRLSEAIFQSDKRAIKFKSTLNKGSSFSFNVLHQGLTRKNESGIISMGRLCEGDFDREFISHMRSFTSTYKNSFENSQCRGLLPAQKYQIISTLEAPKTVGCLCPKVLVVDDDAFNITALDQHLAKLKISCDWAFNGLLALEKIEKRQKIRCSTVCQQYRLVFMDCSMPVLDGFETAKILRSRITKQEIDDMKILACTAFVQQSELDRALRCGMDDYCIKPLNFQVIKKKLQSLGPELLLDI